MSSSSSEEEVVAPKVKTKAVKAPVDSDSEDEVPEKKVKIAQKTKVIEAMSDDSDDSDGGEPAKPVAKKQKGQEGAEKGKAQPGAGTSGVKTKEKGDDNANTLKLVVMGLPWKVDEKAVKKDFASCGEIVNAKILTNDEGKSKGMAFITFKKPEGVKACLKKDGNTTQYAGRTLRVHRASTKKETQAKAGLGARKDEKKPRQDEKKPENNKTGKSSLTLNISSLNPNDIINMDLIQKLARAQEQKDWQGLAALANKIVKRAENKKTEIAVGKGDKHKFRVFVSGLPLTDFDDTAFKKRFADCGEITFTWLPVKSGGEIKGFGAIGYKTQEAFDKAIAYNGTKCKGSVLKVVKSEPAGRQGEASPAGKATEQASKRKNVPVDEEEEAPQKKKKAKVTEEEVNSDDDEAARKAAKKARKAAAAAK